MDHSKLFWLLQRALSLVAIKIQSNKMNTDLPKFEIVEQIGHGQFSVVYKARLINNSSTLIDPFFSTTPSPSSSCPPSPNSRVLNPFLDGFNANQQLLSNIQNIDKTKTATTKERYVAVKNIKFYDIQNSKLRMDCLKEVKLLQQLKHPNIINYNVAYIERNELFIVLELADGGDLSKLIHYYQRKKQLMSERVILKYFTQVCSAVKYIHSKRILHRDIKPANIFMTSSGCVKLGDFGLGRFFSQNTLNAHSIVGTFYYMSPERIQESGYSFSSDVWSLGCVLYELITLNSPFSIMNIEQPNDADKKQQSFNLQWLIDRIIRAEYPSLINYNDISLRLRQLTTECLNPNSNLRPNMDYICDVVDKAYQFHQVATTNKTQDHVHHQHDRQSNLKKSRIKNKDEIHRA